MTGSLARKKLQLATRNKATPETPSIIVTPGLSSLLPRSMDRTRSTVGAGTMTRNTIPPSLSVAEQVAPAQKPDAQVGDGYRRVVPARQAYHASPPLSLCRSIAVAGGIVVDERRVLVPRGPTETLAADAVLAITDSASVHRRIGVVSAAPPLRRRRW